MEKKDVPLISFSAVLMEESLKMVLHQALHHSRQKQYDLERVAILNHKLILCLTFMEAMSAHMQALIIQVCTPSL